jgi:hypothetical protein
MVTKLEIRNRYPRKIELDDSLGTRGPSFLRVRPGGTPQVRPVSIRLMSAPDKDSILLFARHLPKEDLLFLHSDITQPAIVDEWLENIENGTTVTLLAEPDGTLEGYASLHLSPTRWTRKVGEVAINVAPEWQSRGMARLCARRLSRWEEFWSSKRSRCRCWQSIRVPVRHLGGWAFEYKPSCRIGLRIGKVAAAICC